jgi:glutaredoxin
MSAVVVYSKNNCPSCEKLKGQLTLKGVPFVVMNIDTNMDAMDFIAANRHRSVPQVYVDGVHVPNPNTITNEIV